MGTPRSLSMSPARDKYFLLSDYYNDCINYFLFTIIVKCKLWGTTKYTKDRMTPSKRWKVQGSYG